MINREEEAENQSNMEMSLKSFTWPLSGENFKMNPSILIYINDRKLEIETRTWSIGEKRRKIGET